MAGRPVRKATLAPSFRPVQGSRISIPKHFSDATGWVRESAAIEVFLLLLTPGRYRVVPTAEVKESADLVSLRNRTTSAVDGTNLDALDFEDNASATLAARLVLTQVSFSGQEWRLSLPAPVSEILGIESRKGHAVVVLAGRYVEIWSTEAFHASLEKPLAEMVDL